MASLKAQARKVICIGRNYADHIKELNHQRPKAPFFFLKPSSSILSPGEGPVLKPRGVKLHYEVELALVMGKKIRDLETEDEKTALDAIAGYAVGIDMTARNIQEDAMKKGLPWDIAKGFDTFLPISKFITKEQIPNPHSAQLHLSVNGKIRQQDSTELMLFRIPRLLSSISQGVGAVNPGDVIQAGIRVDGKDIEEGNIEVLVEERQGPYRYTSD